MKFFDGFFAFIAAIAAAITFYIFINDDGAKASDPYFWSIIAFIVTYLIVWTYCIPMLIAQQRQHPQLMPIVILNIAGGWSGIFWLAALVWALYDKSQEGEFRNVSG